MSPAIFSSLGTLLHLLRRGRWRRLSSLSTEPSPSPDSVLLALESMKQDPKAALAYFRGLAPSTPSPAAHNLMLRILSRSGSLSDFWCFLRDMSAADHRIDKGTYLLALSSLEKQKLDKECMALTAFYAKAGAEAGEVAVISAAAKAVIEIKDWNSDEALAKISASKLVLSETTVASVILALRQRPLDALCFFRWAGRQPGHSNGSTAHYAMARALGRPDSIQEFWKFVEEMSRTGYGIDFDTYIKLSRYFCRALMLADSVRLYELMMDSPRRKPSASDCAVLLRHIAVCPVPDLELVNRVVCKHKEAGYAMSKAVYDGIHRILTISGKFDEADELINQMLCEGYRPDNTTYSQLVDGLCKAKRFQDARDVLNKMAMTGCTPDWQTWTVLIRGQCLAGELEGASACLTEMIRTGITVDRNILDVMVRGLCANNRASDAYLMFIKMAGKTGKGLVSPYQATYKFLIMELLKVRMLEEAIRLLGSMKNRNFPQFKEPFARHLAKFGTVRDVQEFFKSVTANCCPSHHIYLNVFKAFFNEGRHSEAQDLLFKCPFHIRKHTDITKLFEAKMASSVDVPGQ